MREKIVELLAESQWTSNDLKIDWHLIVPCLAGVANRVATGRADSVTLKHGAARFAVSCFLTHRRAPGLAKFRCERFPARW